MLCLVERIYFAILCSVLTQIRTEVRIRESHKDTSKIGRRSFPCWSCLTSNRLATIEVSRPTPHLTAGCRRKPAGGHLLLAGRPRAVLFTWAALNLDPRWLRTGKDSNEAWHACFLRSRRSGCLHPPVFTCLTLDLQYCRRKSCLLLASYWRTSTCTALYHSCQPARRLSIHMLSQPWTPQAHNQSRRQLLLLLLHKLAATSQPPMPLLQTRLQAIQALEGKVTTGSPRYSLVSLTLCPGNAHLEHVVSSPPLPETSPSLCGAGHAETSRAASVEDNMNTVVAGERMSRMLVRTWSPFYLFVWSSW